jgi:hypothetical protein
MQGRPRADLVINRVHALLARAEKARHEWQEARAASNERRRVLSGIKTIWRRKCDDWLTYRR